MLDGWLGRIILFNFVVMIMFWRERNVLFGVKFVSGVRKRIIFVKGCKGKDVVVYVIDSDED